MLLLKGLMNYMLETIDIEVAYAKPDEQIIIPLAVPFSTTVEQAIEQSKILERFEEIDLTKNKVGIFSKPCTLNTPLREHDRIEIYRPLIADPKLVRKQRANKNK
jgi:uncharacterized protein